MHLLTLAAELDASSVLPAISTVGSLGFAVWYAYFVTTSVLPKLSESHRQERTEMQTRFDAIVHDFLTELKELRTTNTKAIIKGIKDKAQDDGSDG